MGYSGEKPWCESAVVAQMVNGIKLLVRKILQEQLVVNCELLLKAEKVEGLHVHDGREHGSIFVFKLAVAARMIWIYLDFDVTNVCNKLLWSKNQRLGACKLVGKGQMLWSPKAAAKPSKFRCRKKTDLGTLRFCNE